MKKNWLLFGILGLIVVGALVFFIFRDRTAQIHTSQLTGVTVEPDVASRPIIGIIIENSEAARPQTGLDSAGIVFEAVTEGGITRYLALYQENLPQEIEPVRSLRAHFLDWAMGFDASIAHVGGSPQALDTVKSRDAKSLNQFTYQEPYFRDDSRSAPHNVYAKTNDLLQLQDKLGHGKSRFDDIPRSQDQPSQNPKAKDITINFSSPLYNARFVYESPINSYNRYLAGNPHIDTATNQIISVKNVIVMKMPKGWGPQDGATGSGEALIFKDGNIITARWQKPSYEERIKIMDDKNEEVPLNRGDTWFAAIAEDRTVKY